MKSTRFFLIVLSVIQISFICAVAPDSAYGQGAAVVGQQREPEVDPRGPISVPGITPLRSSGGVVNAWHGMPVGKIQPLTHPPNWIWLSSQTSQTSTSQTQTSQNQQGDSVACFRKEIVLSSNPTHVSAWISADWHYRLFINGRLAARGPADPGVDYPGGKSQGNTGLYYCDALDLTPFFRKGVNVVAVEVFTDNIGDWYGSSGHRGLLFAANVTMPDRSTKFFQTDESWRGRIGGYLNRNAGVLTYDAAQEPQGWRQAGFDASTWSACASAGAYWPKLLTSELSPPLQIAYPASKAVRASPGLMLSYRPFADGKSVTVASDGSFTLQFDRILAGYVGLKVKGGAGAVLDIGMNERNRPGGRRNFRMVLKDGVQYFESPFYGSFTFLNISASHVNAPIEIQDVTADFVSDPVAYKGSFACSDDQLTRLWAASRWATQICMQDRHLDSPDHQEPICDPGDYLIESNINYYVFAQPELIRQDLRKFAALLQTNDDINFHTSYSLLWLQMLLDYYDYTGDAALVKELTPVVYGLLDKFQTWRGRNGLISEAPDYMFMDWVSIAGIACHHPPAVIGQGYMTAFYYRGLADGIRAAQLAGDTARVAKYEGLRAGVRTAFNRELWSPEQNLYRDGKPFQTSVKPAAWLPADTNIETFSPHVNTLAVLYDLAPKDRQAPLMKRVMAQQPVNCQPYFYHFVLSALAHCGLFDTYAPHELSRWRIDPETNSFQEMWNSGDYSHAWGGTPLYQLSSKVLGITPAKPGFDAISIRPTLCDLKWARGSAPTPHGNVDVSWQLTPTGMRLDVAVPTGATADVALPLNRFKHPIIAMNGRSLRMDAAAISSTTHITAGTYHFILRGAYVAYSSPIPSVVKISPRITTTQMRGITVKKSADSQSAFETDLSKESLIAVGKPTFLNTTDEHFSHSGGGETDTALRNGTTRDGEGGDQTIDDGKTFRGYGEGDTLTFNLNLANNRAGYDITRIATFAGHADSRASQNYSISIAYISNPTKFVALTPSVSAECQKGSSEIIMTAPAGGVLSNGDTKATGVAAIRFDFHNGPTGFNVYRELQVVGKPTVSR